MRDGKDGQEKQFKAMGFAGAHKKESKREERKETRKHERKEKGRK